MPEAALRIVVIGAHGSGGHRGDDTAEGYAADWAVEQLREPAQRVADCVDVLTNLEPHSSNREPFCSLFPILAPLRQSPAAHFVLYCVQTSPELIVDWLNWLPVCPIEFAHQSLDTPQA